MKYILTYLFIISFTPLLCCTCPSSFDVKTAYRFNGVVFSAKVIEIKYPELDTRISKDGSILTVQAVFGHTIILELIAIYKGKNLKKRITILPDKSNCEYYFKLGKEYLIYGIQDINGIRTNACTRTSLLVGNKDLQYLDTKLKKFATSRAMKK